MEYGELLVRSARLVWRNKLLWFFGIVLSTVSGSSNFLNYVADENEARRVEQFFRGLSQAELIALFGGFIGALALGVAVYLVVTGVLIILARDVAGGGPARLGRGLATGVRKALPILGAGLVLWVPFVVLLVAFGAADIYLFTVALRDGAGVSRVAIALLVLATALALLVFIALGIAVAIINRYANRFIVIEKVRAFGAVRRASVLFRSELGASLLAWLIMFGLTLAFLTFAGALAVTFILIVKALIGAGPIVAIPASALFVALFLTPYGFFEAFGSTLWTLVFLALRARMGDNHSTDEALAPAR